MPIQFITHPKQNFPHPELADERGILAIGGDLSIDRLITAYSFGIFPWYSQDDPIIWWCPEPRFVLYPDKLKVSKSMRPYFNQKKYHVSFDTFFPHVVKACQKIRRDGQEGTWITNDMFEAYCALHERGYAHSVEVWKGDKLAGGLYGVSLGKMFFGESMFSLAPNASKFALISLTRRLIERGFTLIDCQQETDHLRSMGAENISRKNFLNLLRKNRLESSYVGKWTSWENEMED